MAEGQIETWRKKDNHAILVEAVRLDENNAAEVARWCGGELVEEIDPQHPDEMQPGINFNTVGGMARASLHMYVVKFNRAFFASHNRKFELVYEPLNRASTPMESTGDTRRRLGFSDPFAPPGGF